MWKNTLQYSHNIRPINIAHIFPDLNYIALMPLGKLCDDGFKIELMQENINIMKNQKVVICGYRNHKTGLW